MSIKDKVFGNWIVTIFVLPVNVLVVIPLILVYFTNYTFTGVNIFQIMFSLIFAIVGAIFTIWSIALFRMIGNGTLAPWAPTQTFVAVGPYKYVRNPMISGVIFILIAESIFTVSVAIIVWTLLFMVINFVYIKFVEEPGLVKRFGKSYVEYKKRVNAWVPFL